MASSGRTATTKAMGKGSTQFQHLVQTEVPPKVLEEWLGDVGEALRPPVADSRRAAPAHRGLGAPGAERARRGGEQLANVIFATIQDRRGRGILSIRDQNMLPSQRKRRLMTLMQLFLIHRYKADSVHYLTPTDDNQRQTERMKALGIFTDVKTEIGQIIVADVSKERVAELLKPDRKALDELIHKKVPQAVRN